MTPEAQAFYDAIQALLQDDILVQLVDIFSFALGALTGIAFTISASIRWNLFTVAAPFVGTGFMVSAAFLLMKVLRNI